MEFNISEIKKISESIVKYINENRSEKATVLALHGDLGAGKTTLTQNISEVLGIIDYVNSPTFVIQKRYKIESGKFNNLIHIDAYRISSPDEMKVLDFEKELEDKNNLIIIEWPGNIKECLPDDLINIYLNHIEEGIREIRIERKGEDITTII